MEARAEQHYHGTDVHSKPEYTEARVPKDQKLHEQSRTTQRPETFHCFSRLPRELRESIWGYMLPGPRLIEVFVELSSCSTGEYLAANPHKPTILWVSQESRMVGWRSFDYCFCASASSLAASRAPATQIGLASNLSASNRGKGSYPGVLFQPDNDTIYIRGDQRMQDPLQKARTPGIKTANIKSLAIDDWDDRYSPSPTIWPCLFVGDHENPPLLSGLKELFLMRVGIWADQSQPQFEELEDEKWRTQIQTSLREISSPVAPVIRPIRKSRLWDQDGNTRWLDPPHWMSHQHLLQYRANMQRKHQSMRRQPNSFSP